MGIWKRTKAEIKWGARQTHEAVVWKVTVEDSLEDGNRISWNLADQIMEYHFWLWKMEKRSIAGAAARMINEEEEERKRGEKKKFVFLTLVEYKGTLMNVDRKLEEED